jgi:hypothetical protein
MRYQRLTMASSAFVLFAALGLINRDGGEQLIGLIAMAITGLTLLVLAAAPRMIVQNRATCSCSIGHDYGCCVPADWQP